MEKNYWLQYFAEGGAPAGEGDGGAAAGVEAPAAAGQESTSTLEQLGVPKDKAEKFAEAMRRRGRAAAQDSKAATAAHQESAEDKTPSAESAEPAADNAKSEDAGSKASWEELLKDPEYKQAFDTQVQGIINKRFAKANEREASMAKLTPALEMLAHKYGMAANDYEGLASAIVDDDSLYEAKAAELGVDIKTAKLLDKSERELEALKKKEQVSFKQQMVANHMARLSEQANALRAEFPGFDLDAEMQNDMFVKLTAPGMLSVEDAYKAVHRKEIEQAKKEAMTQQAMAAATASIRAGQARPKENGSTPAATITRVPPARRSAEERAELRRRIYAAGASGKKLPIDW